MHTLALILLAPGITILGLLTAATVLIARADDTRSGRRPPGRLDRLVVRLDNAALDAAWMLRTRSLDRRPAPVPPIWTGAAA